jgi:sugar-specific transcriptional regulator TrmB
MNIEELLTKLGLKHPEDTIYLSLLKSHRATIAKISKDTGIYRPTLYRVLPILIEKNLVSKARVGRRTMYIAENPATLQNNIDSLQAELKETLPELTRIYDGSQKRPAIRFFEGKQSIRHIYDDMIRTTKKGGNTYRYESPKDYKLIGKYYPQSYWNRAAGPHGEIEKYVITNEHTQERRRERLNRHSKAIPASYDTFDYNITQLIYNNKVAFIDFDTETATVIENKRFADFQLRLFKMLYGKL